MEDVLVEDVPGEVALDALELVRVALEADEEEPRIELSGDLVEAVGERVAAAEDPRPEQVAGAEPHVRVAVDHGALGTARLEVGRVELVGAGQRGPGVLGAADRALLLGRGPCGPTSR